MLGNEALWDVALECHRLLQAASIPHAVIGGMAVCLHGYQRNTVDLDLLVRKAELPSIRGVLEHAGYAWSAEQAEFRSRSGVPVHLILAAERAGNDSEVRLPDPADERVVAWLEGLPVISLARLIEAKLACGLGNLRRTHKDFADVVELIDKHGLGRSFARHLHKSVREPYRKLITHARGE